jgi:excreted virulence factor EspC (type VII ESX diderm)
MAPPGGDGFELDPAELQTHETQVRELMSAVDGATRSAFQPIDINAFGLIGSTWSWSLHHWTDGARQAIGSSVTAGNHIADQLKAMRETHVETDRAHAETFDNIAKGE